MNLNAPRPRRFTSAVGYNFEAVKLMLLLQIIIGHVVSLSIPTIPELVTHTPRQYLLILSRVLFGFGRESAYLFIFLSGALAGSSIFGTYNNGAGVLKMCRSRFLRLMPMGILAVLGTLLIDFIGIQLLDLPIYRANHMQFVAPRDPSWIQLIGNFLQLQPTLVAPIGTNGPLWTLGYLLQFHLLSCACVFAIPLDVRRRVLLLILVVGLSSLLVGIEFALLFLMWTVAGVFASLLFPGSRIPSGNNKKAMTTLGCAFILFVASRAMSKELCIFAIAASGCALYIGLNWIAIELHASMKNYIEALSRESFGMYAIHMPIVFLTIGLLSILGSAESIFGLLARIMVTLVLVLTASVALGTIEKHFIIRLRRRGQYGE